MIIETCFVIGSAPGTIRRRMTESEATEVYASSGMEVAAHGLTHAAYKMFPHNLCLSEVAKDRENLEKQFQSFVRGMAYPNGVYTDDAVDIIKRIGIVYARTTKSSYDFQIPSDWLRLQPTCHHKDQRLMELAAKFVETDVEWGPWLFYLWGHSYEFEEDNNWEIIETFSEYIGKRDSIWYSTNIEIFDYLDAYKKMIFSMDGTRVYNPTATNLYFETKQETYCIQSGEELLLG